MKNAKGSCGNESKLLQPRKHRSLQEIMEETALVEYFSFNDCSKEGRSSSSCCDEEARANEKLVRLFHTAMAASNVGLLKSLLAEDVEWWFHGAPQHQHMRRVLTGRRSFRSLTLAPARIAAFADIVFVEGCGPDRHTLWTHIWTVKAGRLVQLREYWNVGVLVRLQTSHQHNANANANANATATATATAAAAAAISAPVWKSKLWNADVWTPGLILTI